MTIGHYEYAQTIFIYPPALLVACLLFVVQSPDYKDFPAAQSFLFAIPLVTLK